jgi:hypothetical protein
MAMNNTSAVSWLKAASAGVIGFGILTALAALPAAAGPTLLVAKIIFWQFDGSLSFAASETRLMCAIGGGMMTGWGVMLWLVSSHLYSRDSDLARKIILTSVCSWFAVDSIASVLAGAPLNPFFNIIFLLMFVLPLWHSKFDVNAHQVR